MPGVWGIGLEGGGGGGEGGGGGATLYELFPSLDCLYNANTCCFQLAVFVGFRQRNP